MSDRDTVMKRPASDGQTTHIPVAAIALRLWISCAHFWIYGGIRLDWRGCFTTRRLGSGLFLSKRGCDLDWKVGIAPFLVSTGLVLTCALVVATPISIALSLFLVEHLSFERELAKFLRATLMLLTGLPVELFSA